MMYSTDGPIQFVSIEVGNAVTMDTISGEYCATLLRMILIANLSS